MFPVSSTAARRARVASDPGQDAEYDGFSARACASQEPDEGGAARRGRCVAERGGGDGVLEVHDVVAVARLLEHLHEAGEVGFAGEFGQGAERGGPGRGIGVAGQGEDAPDLVAGPLLAEKLDEDRFPRVRGRVDEPGGFRRDRAGVEPQQAGL